MTVKTVKIFAASYEAQKSFSRAINLGLTPDAIINAEHATAVERYLAWKTRLSMVWRQYDMHEMCEMIKALNEAIDAGDVRHAATVTASSRDEVFVTCQHVDRNWTEKENVERLVSLDQWAIPSLSPGAVIQTDGGYHFVQADGWGGVRNEEFAEYES